MSASAINIEDPVLADTSDSQTLSEFRHRQKRLMTIGEMTAEFAHQVRAPLASAMLYVSQLDTSSKAQERIVKKINERLGELGRMLNDMLGFAAGGKRSNQNIDVREFFENIASTVDASLGEGSSLTFLLEGRCIDGTDIQARPFTLSANADALKGALINLITNSDQAADGVTSIQLGAWRDDKWVYFTVTDDGPGIADDALPRVFEPFFTTRPRGTGLGLAIVQAVAHAHGGDVEASSLSRGSRFTLRLPLCGDRDG